MPLKTFLFLLLFGALVHAAAGPEGIAAQVNDELGFYSDLSKEMALQEPLLGETLNGCGSRNSSPRRS